VVVSVRSRNLFRRLATRGKLGLGESFTAGEWEADDLVAFFELLLRNAAEAAERHPRLTRILNARPRLARRNGLLGARRNISYHYDLGNDLFRLFLDETMTYSCAVFENPDEPLEDAQRRKLRLVCEKLRLGPGDHVLEIGCGWGSFALTAAEEYGARVTGLTISPAQAALARERVAAAGLGDRVRILEEDYRLHEGRYTKVASIEMIAAIGERQLPTFFAAVDRLLEPEGVACVQSILVPEERWDRYRRSPDWIERYVFPGCLIPSLGALTRALGASRLELHDLEEIGPSYGETLSRWRERFLARLPEVRALGYDDRFERTWDFYLAFCEAGFRARALHDYQLVLKRPF
jgi:cyclopropane-fatty-acyl-phospholipid synthase